MLLLENLRDKLENFVQNSFLQLSNVTFKEYRNNKQKPRTQT